MKLNTRPCLLNIVQVYAPTAQSTEEEINEMYGQLKKTLDDIPNRQITMILGDWNAKLGSKDSGNEPNDIIGCHGLGMRNDRGQKLAEFCMGRGLTVTNTNFQHHKRRLYTWKSPGDRFRNQIDYIMVDKRWRSSITNAKTFPGADCGSDHILLVVFFSIRLKAVQKVSQPKITSMNMAERAHFQNLTETKLIISETPLTADAESLWQNLETRINETLEEIISKRGRNLKRSTWITDETWKLIQSRKDIKARGLQDVNAAKEYSNLCKVIQRECRRDKNKFVTEICKEVESHAVKLQTSDLFKKVRLLSKKFKARSWSIESADGQPLHELGKIAERWRDYCKQLYGKPHPDSLDTQLDWKFLELEPKILKSEIVAAISCLKTKKAPGADNITSEVLKALGDNGINTLHNICNHVWEQGIWPKTWTQSVIIPLHKKGSTQKCDNYRTLALIPHASKILLHIINTRLRHYLDWQIPQEQAGFVKGKGTREQILNIRQIVEKCYEFDTPVIMCFVDYNKAFDCVNWHCLWNVLTELGVPKHLTALLQSLYYNSQGIVRLEKTVSKPFKFQKGVRQGCILSPILFNIYGEYIVRKTCEGWNGGVIIGGRKISNLRYADDTTLLAADEAEMAMFLDRMEHSSEELGLTINRSKTKLMIVNRTGKLNIQGTLNLETTNNFIYLGSNISNNGSCEMEIRRRIGMAKGAMKQLDRTWKDRNISINTKRNLIHTLIFSIFMYGAETWTLKKADRDRIDAFEMWCWRRMLGISWMEHRTNASILAKLNIRTRLSTICLRRILEYFGHIARKDSNNLEKLVVTGKIEGKRPRGRSPTRWSDQIRTTLDTTIHKALHAAKNRQAWRDIIRKRLSLVLHHDHDPQ